MSAPFPRRGLYAITDGPRRDLLTAAAAVLAGGAVLLQYRDKTADDNRRRSEAEALLRLCRERRVPLIINDDVELAARVGADGVHVGQSDVNIASARRLLGTQAIIGASCYASLDRARQLAAAGPTYLAFGAFFASPTKPHAQRASLELLREARVLKLPLVAIGGITPDNAAVLQQAGADLLAVVSGVFGASDPEAAARRYAALFTSTAMDPDAY